MQNEFGLRCAVGATSRHILWQFLIEGLMLALSGGVIGLLAGQGVHAWFGIVVRFRFDLYVASIGLGVALLAGVLHPSRRSPAAVVMGRRVIYF